ncbi:KxYKxGKxW signal peptide domain-containing protein, partial [Limosilactobacillus secaliphilus]
MYKSGKKWMVAGLMTTAVLAGLTLSSTNNEVVAHADSVNATSTCPAPSAVSAASDAVVNAQSAVNSQAKVVNAAKDAVNSASVANEGVNKLNDAINQRSAAQAAQKSAADQYNNIDLPAEKAAKKALSTAADKSHQASQAAIGAEAAISDATKNKLPKYEQWVSEATKLQKAANDAKAAWQPVGQAYSDKMAQAEAYAAKAGTPNFSQDYLDQLNAEVASLRATANPLYTAWQDAQSKFTQYMNSNTMQQLEDKVTNAKAYIEKKQKLLDTAKAAHEAYLAAQENYNAAYANSLKSYTAMHDNTAINKAQRLINKIRKDYNIPTDAQLANLKDSKIPGDKDGLKGAQDAANRNADYVKATKTFPEQLKKDNQDLIAAQKKADDLKKQDQQLNDQIEAAQNTVNSLQKQLAAATNAEDQVSLSTKLGDAQYQLSKLQAQLSIVDGQWHDLTKPDGTIAGLKEYIHSVEVNRDIIMDTPTFKSLQSNIDKWQQWLDHDTKTYEDGLANNQAADTLIQAQNALNEAQSTLTQLQQTLAQKEADYQAILNACETSYTVNPSGVKVQPNGQIDHTPAGSVAKTNNAATVSFVNGHVNAAAEGTTNDVTIVSSKWTDGYDAAQAQVAKAQAELKAANQASKVIYISATYKLSNGQTVVKEVPVTVLNNVTTNPDEGQPTDNNKGEGSFTGVKNGEHFVNGKKV